MCGRFVRVPSVGEILESLGVPDFDSTVRPSYNIAPTHRVLAIRTAPSGLAGFEPTWGFTVPWMAGKSSLVINARIEGVHERPLFRNLVSHQRCLVPLAGYYEWVSEPRLLASLGNPKGKVPFYITDQSLTDGRTRALLAAGLWRHSDDGDHVVLLTRPASSQVDFVHDRMPVLLDASMRDEWMRAGDCDWDVLRGDANMALVATRVSSAVNATRNDREELLIPFEGEDQQTLF